MKLWKRRDPSGALPGATWPPPAARSRPADSMITEPMSQAVVFTDGHPQAERCVNCRKCPRCGR